ncbi:hypothetical protein RHMOL_Rhmol07G0088300 [Rhododendron molle]|uniref:Uncharacterized protein n=1 Tax=Rhododendron molle TaxID=49168 RepID=A0ACC0MYF3_RHOML|nr:hypothetical protein RHMOL_Rhmol07G0088300 [Rhododendron molle]
MTEPETIELDPSFDDSSLKAKFTLHGDRKPIDLVYPDSRGRSERNKVAEGGACKAQLENRVEEQEGQLVRTDGHGVNVLGDPQVDSGAGQVSTEVEGTVGIQTKQATFTMTMPLGNIPITRNPVPLEERTADPGALSIAHRPKDVDQLYFIEELESPKSMMGLVADGPSSYSPVCSSGAKPPSPNPRDIGLSQIFNHVICLKRKHTGDIDAEVCSKKQNLAIEWDGSSSDRADGDFVASLPLSLSSAASGKEVFRGTGKNRVVKSSRRSVRRKRGIPQSNADNELVESSACPICGSEIESVEHMLFWCSWAKAIWFACNINVGGDLGGNALVLKWADDMVDKTTISEATEYMGFVALVAWHI